jgi:hypothetical protein
MGWLQDLGNVLHSIGHFVAGGDTNPQPQQNPTVVQPHQQQSNGNQNSVQIAQPQQQQSIQLSQPSQSQAPAPANSLQLYQGAPQSQPQQQPQQQAPAQAQPDNPIQLNTTGLAPATSLQKAPTGPLPTADPMSTAPPKGHASIWHDITHNPVTNVVGGVGKAVAAPFTYLANTDIINPAKDLIDQATGNTAASNSQHTKDNINLGLGANGTNFGGGLEKWAGNSAGALLTVAAPGIGGAVDKGASSIIPAAANQLIKTVVPKVAEGSVIGAGLGATGAAGNDGSVKQVLEGAGTGALTGAAFGGALSGFSVLKNNLFGHGGGASDAPVITHDAATPTPTEVAPGVSNPQAAQQTNDLSEAIKANAVNTTGNKAFGDAVQQAYRNTGIQDPYNLTMHALGSMTNKSDVRQVVEQLVGNSDGNTVNRLTKQFTKAGNADDVRSIIDGETARAQGADVNTNGVRPTGSVGQPSEPPALNPQPTSQTPLQALPDRPTVGQPELQPTVTPAPTVEMPQTPPRTDPNISNSTSQSPAVISDTPNNVAPTSNNVNPQGTNAPIAPNSPNIQTALTKELGTDTSGTHEVMQKDAMLQRANQNAQSANLPQAIATYSTQRAVLQTPQDVFDASALMRRMYEVAKDDPASIAARNNLAEAIAEFGTKVGQGTNIMADVTANLPADAKASIIQKSLTKLWSDNPDKMPVQLQSVSGQSAVQSTLTDYIEQGENFQKQIEALQGKLNTLAEKGSGPEDVAQAHELGSQLKTLELRSQIKNAEATKFYDGLTPKSSITERMAQGARTSMLSSMSGRLNNGINVAGNSAYETLRGQLQGVIGKVINAASPSKNALDTGLSNSRTAPAVVNGLKRVGAEGKNGQLVEDLGSTIWNKSGGDLHDANKILGASNGSGGSGNILQQVGNKAGNLVKAAVTAPRNIFGGAMKDSALLRLSRQEGMAMGKTGDELDAYAAAKSYVASDTVMQKAQAIQDQVAHTNKNPWTGAVEKWFNSKGVSGNTKGFAGLVKNAIMPFAKFPTTMLYNTLTDRNIVADVAHFAISAKKGDVDGITRAISGAVIDGSGGALGWHLAHNGFITNKDSNGYSDGGLYMHFGNRSIPLGLLGVGAESIMGGASMAIASAEKGGNGLEHFIKGIGDTVLNTFKMAGGQSIVGADNPGLTSVQNLVTGKKGSNIPDTLATVGGQEAGQFFPAAGGDVNSLLNMTPLDPSHDAALTKTTKGANGQLTNNGTPSTAKDIPGSALNTLVNKVPLASQLMLPRNPNVAATDPIDRLTRGSHQNGQQVQAAQQLVAAKAPGTPEGDKLALAADKATFLKGGKEMDQINGKYWVNNDGQAHAYNTQQQAQQSLDNAKFQSGERTDFNQNINGKVYQKGSDGKITSLDTKDFEYKNAADQVTSSKNSGDVSGYQEGNGKLLDNISWQLQHADLTTANRDALIQKAVQVQEDYAKANLYQGFTAPKGVSYKTPEITGAKDGYVKTIQEMGAKYGVDINALLSVAAQEGLGGGVGDGGHAFGPFQMNDAGGVLTGKYASSEAAKAYAESPQGIEDAVKQIAAVAKGKTGQAAIEAIVNGFERPANPQSEINNALALYGGGKATLSNTGSGTSLQTSGSSTSSSKAASLAKQNTIGSLLQPTRESFINSMPYQANTANIPQIKLTSPGSLIKARAISVSNVK